MLSISPDAREIQGRILTPEDPGYDAARTVFLGGFDRRPAHVSPDEEGGAMSPSYRVVSTAPVYAPPVAGRGPGSWAASASGP